MCHQIRTIKWRGKGQKKITVFEFDYDTQITSFNLVFSKVLNFNFDNNTNNILLTYNEPAWVPLTDTSWWQHCGTVQVLVLLGYRGLAKPCSETELSFFYWTTSKSNQILVDWLYCVSSRLFKSPFFVVFVKNYCTFILLILYCWNIDDTS